ncbi:MAG: hypothetical protein JWQ33_2809 [Ramlibacter sp.]|nr:hypothetical protein [Ramlibacter sp.]
MQSNEAFDTHFRSIRDDAHVDTKMRTALSRLLRRMKFAVPAIYLAGAMVIWLSFARSNPDGLANIWIAVYTFPFVIIGTFLLKGDFPYVPGRYYEAHALYFWPSVALLAFALFFVFHILQKLTQPAAPIDGRETPHL